MNNIKIILSKDPNKGFLSKYFIENYENSILVLNNELFNNVFINYENLIGFRFDSLSGSGISCLGYPLFLGKDNILRPNLLESDYLYINKFFKKNIIIFGDPDSKIINPIEELCIKLGISINKYTTIYDYINYDIDKILINTYDKYKDKLILSYSDLIKLSESEEYSGSLYDIKSFKYSINWIKDKIKLLDYECIKNKYDNIIIMSNEYSLNNISKFIYENDIAEFILLGDDKNFNKVIKEFNNNNKNNWILSRGSMDSKNVSNKFKYIRNNRLVIENKKFSKSNLILKYNNNSGFSYCINSFVKPGYIQGVAWAPFRNHYHFERDNGSNIDSIISFSTYKHHLDIFREISPNIDLYLLFEGDYYIDKSIIKNIYIDKLKFNNFIVTNNKQKNILFQISDSLNVVSLDKIEGIPFYKKSNINTFINEYGDYENIYIDYDKESSLMYGFEKKLQGLDLQISLYNEIKSIKESGYENY